MPPGQVKKCDKWHTRFFGPVKSVTTECDWF